MRPGKILSPPRAIAASLACGLALCAGCFGMIHEPQRHFYVLSLKPYGHEAGDAAVGGGVGGTAAAGAQPGDAHLPGLIRVRDIDAESAYDRLQMVVRKSKYELGYRQRDTWAVKPGRMLSDLLARALTEHATFDGVSRELSERRPNYLLSGDLHALEVEQAGHTWQAHLALTLQITAMEDGRVLWTGHYDEREPCTVRDYRAAVEALSLAFGRITAAMATEVRSLTPP